MDGEKDKKNHNISHEKGFKERGTKKEKEEKSERLKKDNSKKKEFHIIDRTIRAYPKMPFVFVHE